jgi:hypothetical protein
MTGITAWAGIRPWLALPTVPERPGEKLNRAYLTSRTGRALRATVFNATEPTRA